LQAVAKDLADHHPVERRARPELVGGPVEDPLRRADLAEAPDGVRHALERIRAAHIVGFDDLALEREQVDEHALHGCHVSAARGLG
jgi:hypothetical protein